MRRKAKDAVGIIGLGIIGQGVARHVKSTGVPVFVWSRTPKPFPNFLGSPVEVAEAVDIIQIFVSDGAALRDAISSIMPVLRRQHIVVAHPTVEPNAMIDAARMVEETGGTFLEAPFTGSKIAAEGGQLVYYVSGPEAGLNRARPMLQRSSRAIVPTGPFGAASVLKITTNMITAATSEVLAEALAIVARSGMPPDALARALEQNAVRSGVIDLKLPKMLSGDFSPHFSLKNMLKDAGLALSLAEALGVDAPVASTVASIMFESAEQGMGEEDFAVISRRYGFARPGASVQMAAPEQRPTASADAEAASPAGAATEEVPKSEPAAAAAALAPQPAGTAAETPGDEVLESIGVLEEPGAKKDEGQDDLFTTGQGLDVKGPEQPGTASSAAAESEPPRPERPITPTASAHPKARGSEPQPAFERVRGDGPGGA